MHFAEQMCGYFIKTSCGFANVRGGSEELKTRRLFRIPENKKSKIEGNTK